MCLIDCFNAEKQRYQSPNFMDGHHRRAECLFAQLVGVAAAPPSMPSPRNGRCGHYVFCLYCVPLIQLGKTANAIKVFPRKQPLLLSHLGRLFMPKIPLPYLFNLIYLECVNRIWEIESMLEETKDWNVC